jgi:short-subunit dehydrogenase
MDSYFKNKVIIITGGSKGIGKSLAHLLGDQHAKLVINGRNKEDLLATKNELADKGIDVVEFVGDVKQATDCRNLVETTLKQFGRIDILVNNAGVSMRGQVEELSPELIEAVFKVNTIGPIALTQVALPFIKQSKGSIVFISSLAGLRGLPLLSIYSASKMALSAITESLWMEHKSDGIHIGLVYLGYTEVDHGKTVLGPLGKPIKLEERQGFFMMTKEQAAQKIAKNIINRKRRTIVGWSGKFYYFLTRFLPRISEMIISNSYKKMKKAFL